VKVVDANTKCAELDGHNKKQKQTTGTPPKMHQTELKVGQQARKTWS
jgi:hypothetical protein